MEPWIVLTVIAALVLCVLVLLPRLAARSMTGRAGAHLPPAGPGDHDEAAICLTAPFEGPGTLRIGPELLTFAHVSGQVLQIERSMIAIAFASDDVPTGSGMRTLKVPALVLQLNDPTLPQGVGFAVAAARDWVARLHTADG